MLLALFDQRNPCLGVELGASFFAQFDHAGGVGHRHHFFHGFNFDAGPDLVLVVFVMAHGQHLYAVFFAECVVGVKKVSPVSVTFGEFYG